MSKNAMPVVKILLLGYQAVGKTTLIHTYLHKKGDILGTAGLGFEQKIFNYNGKDIKVHIFDSAGQERFRNIAQNQISAVQGLLVVYDITDRNTFNGAQSWLDYCLKNFGDTKTYLVLANKIDLADQRQVSTEEGSQLALKYNAYFHETSAKLGDNVENSFNQAITTLITRQNFDNKENTQKERTSNRKKDNACCLII